MCHKKGFISVQCRPKHPYIEACGHVSVKVSKGCSGYMLHCEGPSVPYTSIFNLPTNKLISVLDTNRHIQELLMLKEQPYSETLTLTPDVNRESRKKLFYLVGFINLDWIQEVQSARIGCWFIFPLSRTSRTSTIFKKNLKAET